MSTTRRVPLSEVFAIVFCLSCALSMTQPSRAQATTPLDIQISASPAVVQAANGKLPSSILLAVTAKSCLDVDLSGDTLQIAGPGLSLVQPSAGKCTITATLNIDPNTPAGDHNIILLDKTGKPIGSADFAVLEATAGAIPAGIAPQVDVIWEVLTQSVCNDVFGKRVARNFYCIEVKIGNNTGHPLQLAGVGFLQHLDKLPGNPDIILANTSYASTRAVLLRESVLSPRNEFYHSVQATGLIMAGFIPFFHATNPAAHYATAVSIVSGPLLQAMSLVWPDRVVNQLNNLDDESFRDNQIIPNNTQVRTIVFVEKSALTELLNGISTNVSSEIVKELQAEATSGGQQGHVNAEMQNKIRDRVKGTRDNSEQKDGMSVLKFKFHTGDFSPLLVKLALGNLVVVGDEIEYLQRVQVQGASGGGASALTLSPSRLDFGKLNVATPSAPQNVTVTNTSTAGVSGVSITVSGTNQGDFVVQTNTCSSVAAGASCTIPIVFTPSAQDSRAAVLNVAYAGGSPQTSSLDGTGVQGSTGVSLSPSTTLTFTAQKVQTQSAAQTVTLTNTGTNPITGVNVALSGANAADFGQTTTCGTSVNGGANCTISVTFKPLAAGARVATLTVTYTSSGGQQTPIVNLTGTGQ